MALLTLDISTLSTLNYGSNGQLSVERGFTAEGLDTSVDPYSLLYSVITLPGMPTTGAAHPTPALAQAQVQNIVVMGTSANTVYGKVVYSSTPNQALGSYIFTRTSRQVQRRESFLPDGTPLKGSFKDSSGNVIVDRYVHSVVTRSASTIIIEGLKAGNPNSEPMSGMEDHCNSDEWQSGDPGQWLIKEVTTAFSKFSGQYQFRFVILRSPHPQDWSILEVLHDPYTGQEVAVNDSDVGSAALEPYSYGIIGDNTKGYVHFGPFPVTSFSALGLPAT